MKNYINDNAEDLVIKIFAKVLECDEEAIGVEDSIFLKLNLKSIDVIELSFLLENEFDITIDKNDLWNVESLIHKNNMVEGGIFSEEAIHLIKETYSAVNINDIYNNGDNLNSKLNVMDVINFVKKKKNLNGKNGAIHK